MSEYKQPIEKFIRKKQFFAYLKHKPKIFLLGNYHKKNRAFLLRMFGSEIISWSVDNIFINSELKEPDPNWLIERNRWAAIKEGLNADFITGVDGGTKPISEVIKDLVTELESIAEELGSLNRLKQVNNILHVIPVVDYMRDIHKQASLVELVKELQKKLLDSLSEDN